MEHVSSTIAIVALIVGLYQYRRSQDANLFVEFCKRYDDVFQQLSRAQTTPKNDHDQRLAAERYLNLCSEEAWLWQYGYIRAGFWDIWRREMASHMRESFVSDHWEDLSGEFVQYPEFQQAVCSVIQNGDQEFRLARKPLTERAILRLRTWTLDRSARKGLVHQVR